MSRNKSIIALAGAVFLAIFFYWIFFQNCLWEKICAKETKPEERNTEESYCVAEDSQSSGDESQNVSEEEEKVEVEAEVPAEEIQEKKTAYPLHKDITATIFWVGEGASEDNKEISNKSSAWDDDWAGHFGGRDDPKNRKGFYPAKFVPKENPFYFALPYNDFGEKGKRKEEIYQLVYWAKGKKCEANVSILKNRWIKIMKSGKAAYAQWEDVGPFEEDDQSYVFGNNQPKSKTNKNAGIDVSPAVRDYLSLSDTGKVDWQFVDAEDVPDGPWKKIITTSQLNWN